LQALHAQGVASAPRASLPATQIAQPGRQRHHARRHHNRYICKSRQKVVHRSRLRFDRVEQNSTHPIAIGETRPLQQAAASLRKLRSRVCSPLPLPALPQSPAHAKRPPGNRAAFSLGRIVPTEAKPSELSGCILSLAKTGVKAKTLPLQHVDNRRVVQTDNL
jgi:hypothetical protein